MYRTNLICGAFSLRGYPAYSEVDFIQIFQIARSKLSGKSERIHEAIEERPWNLNGVVR